MSFLQLHYLNIDFETFPPISILKNSIKKPLQSLDIIVVWITQNYFIVHFYLSVISHNCDFHTHSVNFFLYLNLQLDFLGVETSFHTKNLYVCYIVFIF